MDLWIATLLGFSDPALAGRLDYEPWGGGGVFVQQPIFHREYPVPAQRQLVQCFGAQGYRVQDGWVRWGGEGQWCSGPEPMWLFGVAGGGQDGEFQDRFYVNVLAAMGGGVRGDQLFVWFRPSIGVALRPGPWLAAEASLGSTLALGIYEGDDAWVDGNFQMVDLRISLLGGDFEVRRRPSRG